MLIYVAITGDRNVLKKAAETILKYKSFRKSLSNVRGKHEIKELQQPAVLSTAHLLLKVLM